MERTNLNSATDLTFSQSVILGSWKKAPARLEYTPSSFALVPVLTPNMGPWAALSVALVFQDTLSICHITWSQREANHVILGQPEISQSVLTLEEELVVLVDKSVSSWVDRLKGIPSLFWVSMIFPTYSPIPLYSLEDRRKLSVGLV